MNNSFAHPTVTCVSEVFVSVGLYKYIGTKVYLNFLLILYREIIGILLYQGFPRPILSTEDLERK